MVALLLRLEGLAVFIAAVAMYNFYQDSWGLFILTLLLPDIGMIGYAYSKKVGAICYNITHSYLAGFIFVLIGLLTEQRAFLLAGFILFAHSGMDRFFGYGLKYFSHFKDTHMQRV